MATTIVKHQYDGYLISQRTDGFVNLTQMALAAGLKIEEFLNDPRTLETKAAIYELQSGIIRHPVEIADNEIWVDVDLAGEYAYQCRRIEGGNKFCLWFNRVFIFGGHSAEEINSAAAFHFAAESFQHSRSSQIKKIAKASDEAAERMTSGTATKVYFIWNRNKNEIKIGFSKNPEARLASFQCGTSDVLQIVKTFQGGRAEELVFHKQFAKYRLGNTELFRHEGELKDFLKS